MDNNVLDFISTTEEENYWEASLMGQDIVVAEAETEEKAVSQLLALRIYANMMGKQEDERRVRA